VLNGKSKSHNEKLTTLYRRDPKKWGPSIKLSVQGKYGGVVARHVMARLRRRYPNAGRAPAVHPNP
jgi:RNase P protein component